MRAALPDGLHRDGAGRSPPRAWTRADADASRARFEARRERLVREREENDARLQAKALAKLDVLRETPNWPSGQGAQARRRRGRDRTRPQSAAPRPAAHERRQARGDLRARCAPPIPSRTTELEYRTPFELLVAVVLSAQATDKSVNMATRSLSRSPTRRRRCARLGEEGLSEPTSDASACSAPRRRTWSRLAQILLEQHGGEVPREREALEALPGVGRKTANVVLNVAFGQPTIAVDTHIFRVANRTGLAPGKDVERSRARAAASSCPTSSASTRTTG